MTAEYTASLRRPSPTLKEGQRYLSLIAHVNYHNINENHSSKRLYSGSPLS